LWLFRDGTAKRSEECLPFILDSTRRLVFWRGRHRSGSKPCNNIRNRRKCLLITNRGALFPTLYLEEIALFSHLLFPPFTTSYRTPHPPFLTFSPPPNPPLLLPPLPSPSSFNHTPFHPTPSHPPPLPSSHLHLFSTLFSFPPLPPPSPRRADHSETHRHRTDPRRPADLEIGVPRLTKESPDAEDRRPVLGSGRAAAGESSTARYLPLFAAVWTGAAAVSWACWTTKPFLYVFNRRRGVLSDQTLAARKLLELGHRRRRVHETPSGGGSYSNSTRSRPASCWSRSGGRAGSARGWPGSASRRSA